METNIVTPTSTGGPEIVKNKPLQGDLKMLKNKPLQGGGAENINDSIFLLSTSAGT